MYKDKVWNAMAVGAVSAFVINMVSLGSDLACHMHNPTCSYEYQAVRLTPPSSVAWAPQRDVTITSTST